MLEETPLEAIEMIERIAHGKMVPTSGTPGNAACYVKLVPQIKTWWCGYATTLQTIYGLGLQGTVVGSTDAQKQTTIANEMGNPNDTAYVYKIVNYLNSKLSSSKYYYTLGSGQTKQSFATLIGLSLMRNRPVVLHARTGSLPYYNGLDLYHYLSVDAINVTGDSVRIVDCHYNVPYQGVHYVNIDQALRTVSPAGRYIILN